MGQAPLITDPPPTSFTAWSKKQTKKSVMWYMTHEMWHITHDTGQVGEVKVGKWNFCQSISSLALTVWPWRCFEDDTWQVTFDLWHVIHDTWHMTHDIWKVGGRGLSVKFQLPCSNSLAVEVFWRWHMTYEIWLVTCDTWHITHDMWQVGGGGHSVKFLASQLKRFREGGHSVKISAP